MAAMSEREPLFPITNATAATAHRVMFAPWVKQLGLCDFEVREGYVRARLPETDEIKMSLGSVSGQALMAAIDTVAAMAMRTTDRPIKGTVNQHTQFLRPAKGDDMFVEVNVLRFGKAIGYAECRVTLVKSGELVAHAVTEYAF
jgi:uncharacterized protein (TIGR00369 family)